MRNRLFEISAVLVGIAIVVGIYLYRTGGADVDAVPVAEPARGTLLENEQPGSSQQNRSVPVAPPSQPAASAEPTPAVVADVAEIEAARVAWQSAVADIDAVEAELTVLDEQFDAKEAELAEMESQGMDPELLEEEMLIFLDGIVDEYDALETRLAEAEAVETAAAERLATLQGSSPDLQ